MITLINFISEARENKIPESQAYLWMYNILKSAKMTKEQLTNGLEWLSEDIKILQGFEKYINSIDKDAWIYMASDDEFLDKSKISDIVSRLVDYIVEKL